MDSTVRAAERRFRDERSGANAEALRVAVVRAGQDVLPISLFTVLNNGDVGHWSLSIEASEIPGWVRVADGIKVKGARETLHFVLVGETWDDDDSDLIHWNLRATRADGELIFLYVYND